MATREAREAYRTERRLGKTLEKKAATRRRRSQAANAPAAQARLSRKASGARFPICQRKGTMIFSTGGQKRTASASSRIGTIAPERGLRAGAIPGEGVIGLGSGVLAAAGRLPRGEH